MITLPIISTECRRYNALEIFGMSFLFESVSNNLSTQFSKYFSRALMFADLSSNATAQKIHSTSLRERLSQMLMLATLVVSQTVFSIEVRDEEGSLVQLDESAERIISLAPSLTELLYAAGYDRLRVSDQHRLHTYLRRH